MRNKSMSELAQELVKVIHKHFDELIEYPNVLNVGIGKKVIDGKETECVTIFVSKKKTPDELKVANEAMLPKCIDGVCTNVVEMSSPTFKLGKTSVSRLPYLTQRKLAGGITDLADKGDS